MDPRLRRFVKGELREREIEVRSVYRFGAPQRDFVGLDFDEAGDIASFKYYDERGAAQSTRPARRFEEGGDPTGDGALVAGYQVNKEDLAGNTLALLPLACTVFDSPHMLLVGVEISGPISRSTARAALEEVGWLAPLLPNVAGSPAVPSLYLVSRGPLTGLAVGTPTTTDRGTNVYYPSKGWEGIVGKLVAECSGSRWELVRRPLPGTRGATARVLTSLQDEWSHAPPGG